MPYKEVKQKAAETRAKLTGGLANANAKAAGGEQGEGAQTNGGKKQKTLSNGFGVHDVVKNPEQGEGPAPGDDNDVQMTG